MEYFKQEKEDVELNIKNKNTNLKNAFKLNLKNEELKSKIEPYIISSKQLLDLFDLKYLDNNDHELNNCSTEEYINRISIIHNPNIEEKDLNQENDKEVLNNSKNSNESLLELTIYTYTKVISLGKGNLFGELALRNPQAVRTATIITSTSCHFSYLNKITYNNSLKMNLEFHKRVVINFYFIEDS